MSKRQTQILEAATRLIARTGVRGLRVEELAAEASVSTGLIYYHFGDRAGLMRRTLAFINDRAEHYTEPEGGAAEDPRTHLEQMLLLELRDEPGVVENSTAWGEFQASAKFDPELREQLRRATAEWVEYAADLIRAAQDAGTVRAEVTAPAAAERLTSLVEGLSGRWLAGSLELERARGLLREAYELELGPSGN
ncbi:TetR/AcrR family transcriptional regulator [Streptomyces aureocirculatus]|uniref:TetR/AcrR family transcriptional regulator n=1 Tax=Streptomyces aureocirculatus TaxID=67275 RepID=UPI0004C84BE2|nr:TetR family transcriptional regulator C-terminal domain-containing protein [Streptomyces aureocirculatus]